VRRGTDPEFTNTQEFKKQQSFTNAGRVRESSHAKFR